jgi:hypothetical protein
MLEEKKEENEYLVPEERERLNLSRNQKIAVAVLGIFGVLVIVFWYVQFNRTLSQSLTHTNTADNTANSDTNVDSNGNVIANDANKNDARLKTQDTDGDGLSDWDELNTYKTSPYLADSDGDGYSDKNEIDSGNDPNCPQGQTCNHSETIAASSTDTTGLDSSLNSSVNSSSQSLNNTANNSASLPGSSNVDAASLRAALIASGQFDKNTLNNISDADLLKAYQGAISSSSSASSISQ